VKNLQNLLTRMPIEITKAKLAASPELSGALFRAKKNALSG